MADTAVANQENIKPSSSSSSSGSTKSYLGFNLIRTLGEGAYGEVLLVTDRRNPEVMAAMKIMNLKQTPIAKKECKKEALIQQLLTDTASHPNIVHFIGYRTEGDLMRLFIEYADGGELFDQIEPEKGVESAWKARHYFRQLIEGVKFLHQCGIAHRDIKPENLFLTKRDLLKIGDYGLATVFRHDGKERVLTMPCGTRPYASPELLKRHYRAQPTDIWSCGIVLVAMLCGELPWQAPLLEEESFRVWITAAPGVEKRAPWSKIDDPTALFLLKSILNDNEKTRISVEKILNHPWLMERNLLAEPQRDKPSAKRRRADPSCSDSPTMAEVAAAAAAKPLYSQPQHRTSGVATSPSAVSNSMVGYGADAMDDSVMAAARAAFSQPSNLCDLMDNDSQMCSQRLNGIDALNYLERRMTRFCVLTDVDITAQRVIAICHANGVATVVRTPTEIMGTYRDICFMVSVYHMANMYRGDVVPDEEKEAKVMVDFRRSRGDGLEFKRLFHRLKADFGPIIDPKGNDWLEREGMTKSQLAPPTFSD